MFQSFESTLYAVFTLNAERKEIGMVPLTSAEMKTVICCCMSCYKIRKILHRLYVYFICCVVILFAVL